MYLPEVSHTWYNIQVYFSKPKIHNRTKMKSNAFLKKIKSLVAVSSCSSIILGGLLYYNNDEQFFDNFAMPLLRLSISPENIHKLGVFLCKWNLIPKNTYIDPPNLVISNTDMKFVCKNH